MCPLIFSFFWTKARFELGTSQLCLTKCAEMALNEIICQAGAALLRN